jgi:UDP-N-acetyl-2-amino-2-deoxyglucuronate dehydrogenase
MTNIKFAIVGCGSIGKRHIAVLDANPDAEIIAICDTDEAKCKELSNLYGGLKYFTDYMEMLNSIQCDVVNVVTPHQLHADMSVQALEKGFHVLVEKPMALTSVDCDRMNDAAVKTGNKLWVVKQNRFNIPIRLAKDAIEKNRLGKIFMVKCDVLWNRYQGYYDESPWRGVKANEGGALYTQASHFIDLLVWWFGDITSAQTNIETQNHKIETEDTGLSVVKFNNNALGSIIWTTCVYNKNYEGSITIVGEKGTIKIGGQYLNKIEYWDVEGYPLPDGIDFSDKPNAYGKYQGTSSNHDKVIAAIIAQLQGKAHETVDGFEGIRSIKAIELMYQNAK